MSSKEKRRFKRYPKVSEIDLKHGKKLFRAKTIDYSVDGIGAIVENTPRASIRLLELSSHFC